MDFIRIGRSKSKGDSQSVNGWRRVAYMNIAALTVTLVAMVCCLLVSMSRIKGVAKADLFFAGTCDGGSASKLNVMLHLLLNILSTAIFASSNFFMQVLNSPSREEVDVAHANGLYLCLGVSSVRNVFRMSRFKTWTWIILLLSSIPMHLLFNSMVFQTDYRTVDYQLIIANADFINGAPYYVPGASLSPSGFYSFTNTSSLPSYGHDYRYIWGDPIPMSDYQNPASEIHKNISTAITNSINWDKISAKDCYNMYNTCHGLTVYRDVIMVVNTNYSWVRNKLWELTDDESYFWDTIVPESEPNSLWFSGKCNMKGKYVKGQGVLCENGCQEPLGRPYSGFIYGSSVGYVVSDGETENLNDHTQGVENNVWTYPFFSETYRKHLNTYTSGIQSNGGRWSTGLLTSADLTVDHCLVEPVDRVCHVGLFNPILLAVTMCVLVKTVTAVIITITLGRRDQEPLVTLGDAIASFIRRPDNSTIGTCTVGQFRRAARYSQLKVLARPRRWKSIAYRRWRTIPMPVWFFSYLFFAIIVGIVISFLESAQNTTGLGSFLESDANPLILRGAQWSFISGVLTANSPQLLLSFWYLFYNNLFTRLQMAKEWSQFGSGFHPLRVTNPRGEQYSTYRLQLPYKYSIPLIICSIFLHWTLSNALYVFVSQGGYYNADTFLNGIDNASVGDPSLPKNTIVTVGYSIWALFIFSLAICVLICVPVALSFLKLSGNMTNVGSNSIAISAACHVSPEAKAGVKPPTILLTEGSIVPLTSQLKAMFTTYLPLLNVDLSDNSYDKGDNGGVVGWRGGRQAAEECNTTRDDETEVEKLLMKDSITSMRTQYSRGQITKEDLYEKISQRKIRWGVIRMPSAFYREYLSDQRYNHLGFGVEGEKVFLPRYGELYA